MWGVYRSSGINARIDARGSEGGRYGNVLAAAGRNGKPRGRMKRVVLLFSGQGAQKVGMGADFLSQSHACRDLATQADEVLGFALSKVMTEGPDEELTRTSRCQPALFLHGMMALALLRERLPGLEPVMAAGLSLGEFTAHAAAGTFPLATGLQLVCKRGAFMEDACNATVGSMAALIGGEVEKIHELAASADVDVANFNSPGQIVLSGSMAGIDDAVARAKDYGIRRAIKLNVAGAYHSRLMKPAQERLAAELAAAPIQMPGIPVISNFAAKPVSSPEEIRETLEKQVTGSVRWTESIQHIAAQGHHLYLELGPGKVLSGLVSKIDPEATVHAIEDLATLEAAVAALA